MLQFDVVAKKGRRGVLHALGATSAALFLAVTLAACGGGSGDGFTDDVDAAAKTPPAPGLFTAMSIATDDAAPVAEKDRYVGANLDIADADGRPSYAGHATIKGHGNTTWDAAKKPYRLKLDTKAGLFGMPKDRNWILLANFYDKTLLRNRSAFELGRRFGMAWTPRAVPFELTLNGEYKGVYDLIETVRVDKNRVNIADSDGRAPEQTGFIVEINARMDEAVCWKTTHGLPMCIDTPDAASDEQAAYIRNYVQQAEDALFSDHATDAATGYERYFDVPSLIDWFLVNEILKNQDAKRFASIYLYKDANGKLKFGPLWDFDLAAGNVNYSDAQYPEGWWVADGPWIARMKQIDPTFETRVRARWDELKASQIDTLTAYIDDNARALTASGAADRNFRRWPVLDKRLWPNPVATGSYQGEVDYLKNWLTRRIAWLDANL